MNGHILLREIGAALVLSAALLAGCGGGGGSGDGGMQSGPAGGTGTLRVSLTDAPACGFDAVFVTVSKIRIHSSPSAPDADTGWQEIVLLPPRRVDLLSLTNGVLFELGSTPLPAGRYEQIRLELADNATVPMANSVVPTGGMQTALNTPSGQSSGIKLLAGIDVPRGETADVVLDFDACRSIVRRGNSGRFNLKPVVSVIPLISAGAISGQVHPALLARGVEVTGQSNGQVVKAAVPDASGSFRLSPVAAGTYTVVITAAGSTTRAIAGVPVVTGGNTVLSTPLQPVTLPDSPTGAVVGVVTPALAEAGVRALQSIGSVPVIEVAQVRADGVTGGYQLTLPRANTQLANWGTGALPLLFFEVGGSGGRYTIEAWASGFVPNPATSPLLTLGAVPLTQNFALIASP